MFSTVVEQIIKYLNINFEEVEKYSEAIIFLLYLLGNQFEYYHNQQKQAIDTPQGESNLTTNILEDYYEKIKPPA